MAPGAATSTVGVTDEAVSDVANALLQSGRVVPGLTIEADGRARSWWWPLPAASHRSLLATLVENSSAGGQRRAAARLADAIDGIARQRLVAANAVVARRRPGRPGVHEAWARSLVSADPWLAPCAQAASAELNLRTAKA